MESSEFNESKEPETMSTGRSHGIALRRRLSLGIVAATFVAAGVALFAPGAALACDTSYWNISCQDVYQPAEGHTAAATQVSQPVSENYSPYPNDFRTIWTTAGGTWKGSFLDTYGTPEEADYFYPVDVPSGEKVGCYNPTYNGNLLVNCRRGAI